MLGPKKQNIQFPVALALWTWTVLGSASLYAQQESNAGHQPTESGKSAAALLQLKSSRAALVSQRLPHRTTTQTSQRLESPPSEPRMADMARPQPKPATQLLSLRNVEKSPTKVPAHLAAIQSRFAPMVAKPVASQARPVASLAKPVAITSQSDYQVLRLDGPAIACNAARNWSPSQALRARGRTIVRAYCDEDECSRKAAAALDRFLRMQAANQEDVGAASALRAYYTRIGLAEQMIVVSDGYDSLAGQEDAQRRLVAGGIASGVDLSMFEREQIELDDQAAQILSKDRQLDSLLQHIAQTTFVADQMGVEALEVWPQSVSCEALVGFAHANRQDLQAWIYLRSQINSETAPVIAKMFSTAIGGFGLPLPIVGPLKKLFCGDNNDELAASMRAEMSCVIAAHRDWITQTVNEKCYELQLAYERHTLSLKLIDSWQQRIDQLEALARNGQAEPKSLSEATTGLLAARSEEISRRMEAKLAEVNLAEATGGLACRCCNGQPWLVTGN